MLIHVKVEADSRTEEVIKKSDVSYLVRVRAPRERNEANVAMLLLLSQHLGTARNKLKIITGHHTPSKIVEVMET